MEELSIEELEKIVNDNNLDKVEVMKEQVFDKELLEEDNNE